MILQFLLKLVGALLAAWVALVFGIALIYVNRLSRPACARLPDPPAGYQDLSLVSPRGVAVNAWWLPPTGGAAVILLGGHGASRDAMRPEAEMLARAGAGVLLLDSRSCAGQRATFGVQEIDELRAAVGFAHSQPGVTCLGVLGFSAGGVAAIRGAARMPEIDRLAAEGNFANLWQEATDNGAPLSLTWQVNHAVGLLLWPLAGEWPPSVDMRRELAHLGERQVLLIHGEKEARRNAAEEQYQAVSGPDKILWIVPGAGHGEYRAAAPAEYEERIVRFFTHP